MSLIALILGLIVLGLAIWGVQRFLPFDAMIKNLICFLLVAIACIWMLGALGVVNFGRIHL